MFTSYRVWKWPWKKNSDPKELKSFNGVELWEDTHLELPLKISGVINCNDLSFEFSQRMESTWSKTERLLVYYVNIANDI